MKEFMQLSNSVIKTANRNVYYTKVDSAKSLQKVFIEEESQYEISAGDVEIQIKGEDETFAEGVLLVFCKEKDGSCSYVDVLICDVLGTFISDWY